MSASETEPTDVLLEVRARLDALIDEYRTALHGSLNGLTEAEARLRLVPSKTTLLGLVSGDFSAPNDAITARRV